MKVCLIDNMAALYRKAIYLLMDKEWNMNWYFGESADGIKTMDVSLLKHVHLLNNIYTAHIPGYWLKNMSSALKDNDIIIMIGEPDLWSTWGLLLRNKFSFHRKKVYFWTHGWYGKEGRLKTLIKKIYFNLGDGVITYGDYARNLMIKEGFNPNKLWAIHNSLDYSEQFDLRNSIVSTNVFKSYFKNNNKTLIFIGRLTPVKRLDLLVDAIAKLKKNGELYNLVFVGDGSQRDMLERLVEENDVKENVWFYGACYDEKTNAELIYNADLCVAPGNIGLTAMHVLMFGTPAATHNNFPYQMPEFEAIHEGTTGTFFKQNDSVDIARAISEWFAKHSDDRDTIRKACFSEIDTYWNPQFQMNVLKQILNN